MAINFIIVRSEPVTVHIFRTETRNNCRFPGNPVGSVSWRLSTLRSLSSLMAEPAIYYTISNGFTIKPTTTGLNTNDVGFNG